MKVTLRQFNNGLSLVVIALCLYVIAAPFLPEAAYRFQDAPPLVRAEEGSGPEKIPDANTLVIPRMKLQQEIHEGGEWVLNKGVWHTPDTGNPVDGSNMVLSGHRFTYGGPAVFYHLDKVRKGDMLVVYWEKQRHQYEVTEIKEVPPTAVEILDQTDERRLTIYTCTPLWSAKNRLVIIAEPTGGTP